MRDDHRSKRISQPHPFRTQDAESLGISRRKLRNKSLYPAPFRGVRLDTTNTDELTVPKWADEAWQNELLGLRAVIVAHPEAVACHFTAARLFGWPLPKSLRWETGTTEIWVTHGKPGNRIRLNRVRHARRTSATFIYWLDQPFLDPIEVFIGLAPSLTEEEIIRTGEAMIGEFKSPPLATLDQIKVRVSESARVPERKKLLRALSRTRLFVDSPPETDLRLWAVSVGFPEPTVHPRVWSALRQKFIEPDLGFVEVKLALEYEGGHHLASRKQWDRDIERDDALRAEGWTVFKVTASTDYALLEKKIRSHFEEHRRRLADGPHAD